MSSISHSISSAADLGRFSILEIRQPATEEGRRKKEAEDFQNLKYDTATILTKEYRDKMISRALYMTPTILKNIQVIKAMAQVHIFDRVRNADQLSTLLAGYYALISDDEITEQEAVTLLKSQDWNVYFSVESKTSQTELIDYILNKRTMFRAGSHINEYAFSELISLILDESDNAPEIGLRRDMERHMMRYGMMVDRDDEMLWVAKRHSEVERLVKDTMFAANYSSYLQRVEGAVEGRKSFAGGKRYHAVGVEFDGLLK